MKFRHAFALVALACLLTAPVSADEAKSATCEGGKCTAGKTCAAGTCTDSKTCEGGTCPISQAVAKSMKALPQMNYLVGTEKTHCPMTAEKLAKKSGEKIRFTVGKKVYSEKGKAMDQLISQTETMLATFTTPKTCGVSGKTTIAGEECGCSVMAGNLAKKMKSAVASVKGSYLVGTEACDCPQKSAAMAKEKGLERTFVVGDMKTTCPKTARLAIARARYEAAAKVAAEASLADAT